MHRPQLQQLCIEQCRGLEEAFSPLPEGSLKELVASDIDRYVLALQDFAGSQEVASVPIHRTTDVSAFLPRLDVTICERQGRWSSPLLFSLVSVGVALYQRKTLLRNSLHIPLQ